MKGLNLIERGLLEPWRRCGDRARDGDHPAVSRHKDTFMAYWSPVGIYGGSNELAPVAAALCRSACWSIDRPLVDAARGRRFLNRMLRA